MTRDDAMNQVTILVDGRRIATYDNVTVAAALLNAGVTAFRASVRNGEPRGPVCGMGICYECRVTIDGVAHRRACLEPCVDGMEIGTTAPVGST